MSEAKPPGSPFDLFGIAKLAETELAKNVYRDGVQPGLTETGLLAADMVRAVRHVFQPLFTAIEGSSARLTAWTAEAIAQVPPERLAPAKPALLNATIAAIGVEEDTSQMRSFYVKLLASMMDRELQNDVHPAFPHILQELSPLDAWLLQIAPHGNGLSLPVGTPAEELRLGTGVIGTLEDGRFASPPVPWQIQRFFVQVVTKVASEHAGFLEIVPPSPMVFHAREGQPIGWDNLRRLDLISHIDMQRDRHGIGREYFYEKPATHKHMKGLLLPEHHGNVFSIHARTILGRALARACIPDYSGPLRWHPVGKD